MIILSLSLVSHIMPIHEIMINDILGPLNLVQISNNLSLTNKSHKSCMRPSRQPTSTKQVECPHPSFVGGHKNRPNDS